MAYRLVDSGDLVPRRGPHPAASMYDKHVSERLELSAFEVYRVELPPGAETVEHDHSDDRVEDVYAFLTGSGWIIVDGEVVSVSPGQFVAVTIDSRRQVRAGEEGLHFTAICG